MDRLQQAKQGSHTFNPTHLIVIRHHRFSSPVIHRCISTCNFYLCLSYIIYHISYIICILISFTDKFGPLSSQYVRDYDRDLFVVFRFGSQLINVDSEI